MLFLVVVRLVVVSVDKDANDAKTVRLLIRDVVVRESNVQTRTEWEDTIITQWVTAGS
jgi:hypothetical protein